MALLIALVRARAASPGQASEAHAGRARCACCPTATSWSASCCRSCWWPTSSCSASSCPCTWCSARHRPAEDELDHVELRPRVDRDRLHRAGTLGPHRSQAGAPSLASCWASASRSARCGRMAARCGRTTRSSPPAPAISGVFPLAMATIPSEVVPPGLTATALSLTMGTSEIIGGVFAPWIAGRAGGRTGLAAPLWIVAGLAVAVGIVALLLRETAPVVLARRAGCIDECRDEPRCSARSGIRLCDRRRRHRGLRAGRAAVGGSRPARLPDRGRPARPHPFIHVPALVGAAIGTASELAFLTEPQPTLDNRRIPVPRGHVVGGSGSINGMVYFRGQPRDYRRLGSGRQPGLELARGAAVFPALREQRRLSGFARCTARTGRSTCAHIPQAQPAEPGRSSRPSPRWAAMPPARTSPARSPEGYGLRQGTIRRGRRDSTAVAYLRPALARPNLTLLT